MITEKSFCNNSDDFLIYKFLSCSEEEWKLYKSLNIQTAFELALYKILRPKSVKEWNLIKSLNFDSSKDIELYLKYKPKTVEDWILLKDYQITTSEDLKLYHVLSPPSPEVWKAYKRYRIKNKTELSFFKLLNPSTVEEWESFLAIVGLTNENDVALFKILRPSSQEEWKKYKHFGITTISQKRTFEIVKPKDLEEWELYKDFDISSTEEWHLFKRLSPKSPQEWNCFKQLKLTDDEEINLFIDLHPQSLEEWRSFKWIKTKKGLRDNLLEKAIKTALSTKGWINLEEFVKLYKLDLLTVRNYIFEKQKNLAISLIGDVVISNKLKKRINTNISKILKHSKKIDQIIECYLNKQKEKHTLSKNDLSVIRTLKDHILDIKILAKEINNEILIAACNQYIEIIEDLLKNSQLL
ncbi:MAG: hypothetical protein ACTSYD_09120 [Candidatus Heimdallarchaeaceae archaeon]